MSDETPYRIFKCRNTERTKKWLNCHAQSPAEAARMYAESTHCCGDETITVMNHGQFRMFTQKMFVARKIK